MAITEKRPSTKYTVGAQYICFNATEWSSAGYEEDVTKLPTVVDVDIADNADSYESYASGAVYESDTIVTYKDISVTQLVFPEDILAKMRGDQVDTGIIMSGGVKTRPYFGYGVPIIKKDGTRNLRWYPKCKLVENSDKTATSTATHSDQTDTLTIRAYGFDEDMNQEVSVLTDVEDNEGITEAAFFAAPLTTVAGAKALRPTTSNG
jgi:phi13 family phage major tail protein